MERAREDKRRENAAHRGVFEVHGATQTPTGGEACVAEEGDQGRE